MSSIKKICVFPNDPLLSYFSKGEIKFGYFNPKNFFDEVHVISLFDNDIEEWKVKDLAGNAILKIHILGKVNLSNYKSFEEKINTVIKNIKPNILRAYNPLIQGWLATKIGKKNKIPIVVSIHTNYDQQRNYSKKLGIIQYLKFNFITKKIEKFSIRNCDTVICVYQFIKLYAKKMGAKYCEIIYNKVDLKKFTSTTEKKLKFSNPIIISVGRLINQKPHRILIESIKNLDVTLVIIGDGPNFESLNFLAKSLKIENKVKFIKSIPNNELPGYYSSSIIYAQPLENLDGIPIPVIEAMACKLPIVISKHSPDYSEIIDDCAILVENTSDGFKKAFEKILNNKEILYDMQQKSFQVAQKINGEIMEQKELEIYKRLIKTN